MLQTQLASAGSSWGWALRDPSWPEGLENLLFWLGFSSSLECIFLVTNKTRFDFTISLAFVHGVVEWSWMARHEQYFTRRAEGRGDT